MHLSQLFNNVRWYKNISKVLEDSKKRGKCKKSKGYACRKKSEMIMLRNNNAMDTI
jgi:hypothetical protein